MAVQTEVGIQDYVALVNRYLDRGLTDGLPVIPPSSEAVNTMCAATGLPPEHVVGEFPLRPAPVTVKDIAVNALMAGCRPDYMPVILAGYEALFQPDFGTSHMTQSAGSFLAWFMLGGPIRHRLGVKSGANAFGPGARANAAIGRAFRLGVINLAGSNPNVADRAAIGTAYRLTMVNGEDEERSPWPSLAVEHGFGAADNVLVTMKSSQPSQLALDASTPEQLLDAVLDEWSTIGRFSSGVAIHPDEQPVLGGFGLRGRSLLLFGEGHRRLLASWSKEQIRAYLTSGGGRARRGRTAGEMRAVQFIGWGRFEPDAPDSTWTPAVRLVPEHILIVAAGGDGPTSLMGTGMSFDIRKLPPVPYERTPQISAAGPSAVQRHIDAVERTMQAGLFDGLPIMLPDSRSIEAMVAATGREADDELGRLVRWVGGEPLGSRPFTIGEVAATAFVAGCLPEYMPVLTTALEILLEPRFEMHRVLTEQDGSAPWVILNGPVRQTLKVNAWRNLFGPYFRANSAMGRALNLCLRSIGGVHLGIGLGTAYQYTGIVIAEFEEESPWAPLHTEFGFRSEDSTVLVLDCGHPINVGQAEASRPGSLFRTIADDFATVQRYAGSQLRPGLAMVLAADARIHIKEASWTRGQAQQFLMQFTGRTAGELRALGYGDSAPSGLDDGDIVQLLGRPEDAILLAGGGGGPVGGMLTAARFLDIRKLPAD
jgi:hypothetical protein